MSRARGIVDPATGRPRLLAEKCATCIFRPCNPMRLRPGRLRELVAAALARTDRQPYQGYITCHDTLPYGDHPEMGEAMCRGFYDAHGPASNAVRIYERLGGFVEVPPPGQGSAP